MQSTGRLQEAPSVGVHETKSADMHAQHRNWVRLASLAGCHARSQYGCCTHTGLAHHVLLCKTCLHWGNTLAVFYDMRWPSSMWLIGEVGPCNEWLPLWAATQNGIDRWNLFAMRYHLSF